MSRLLLLLWALLGAQALAVGAETAQPDKVVNMDSKLPGNGELAPNTTLNAIEQMGRQLYVDGVLANGKPLVGKRANGIKLAGVQAACVQCHRRSGLGGVEGNEAIMPITGRALFGGGEPVIVQIDKRFNQGLSTPSKPYDDKSFAAAVKQGRHVSGRKLSALMPRYDLSDEQLQAVAAYLRTLSVKWSPGAGQQEMHLATVIAPGVSPERHKAFVDTLNAMVNQHNVNVTSGKRQKILPRERQMHTRRKWAVDIWELTGPSSTWGAQLDKLQQQNPAFAIVSGLAQDEWQPVQDFCEHSKVVCWFPSVDLVPEGADKGAYSLYFSGGVQLEAEVITNRLMSEKKKPEKIVQVVGPNPIARGAAQAAHKLLVKAGVEVQDIEWSPSSSAQLTDSLKRLESHDALLVWLQAAELKDFALGVSVPKSTVFVSSTMIGEAVPAWSTEWSKNAWLVQRLEMPEMRAANLTRFHDWIKYRQLPLVDEKMQSEVYFAVNSFSWMMSSMLNNLYTDYMIDRAEATLSMREAMQVQEEVQAMMMGGGGRKPQTAQKVVDPAVAPVHAADIPFLMKREGTTAYPRLSLGIGQRFASKGAYIQKIAADASHPDGSNAKWIVP
jgi:mono/diheme cytochrome c family protein